MFRTAIAIAGFALFAVPVSAEAKKPIVLLAGSVVDKGLQKEAPGIIVSQKEWEKLTKVWGIKDIPKVDFDKEILVVGTTIGSRLDLDANLDVKGNLEVTGVSTSDIGPEGFRYTIKSVSRAGIKTVNGKELPKE